MNAWRYGRRLFEDLLHSISEQLPAFSVQQAVWLGWMYWPAIAEVAVKNNYSQTTGGRRSDELDTWKAGIGH